MKAHIERAKIELETAAAAIERAARALALAGAEAPKAAHDPLRSPSQMLNGDDPALTDFCTSASEEARLAESIRRRARGFADYLQTVEANS